MLPDENEVRRAQKIFGQALGMYENVSLGSLTGRGDVISDAYEGVKSALSFVDSLTGGKKGEKWSPVDENSAGPAANSAGGGMGAEADVYVVVNVSCAELFDLKAFVDGKRDKLIKVYPLMLTHTLFKHPTYSTHL